MRSLKAFRAIFMNIFFIGCFVINAQSQEFAVFNDTISWNMSSINGFYFFQPPSGSPTNWSNYYNGKIYTRYEVISQSTGEIAGLQVGIWQWQPNGQVKSFYTETMAPLKQLNGAGSVVIDNTTPSNWWKSPPKNGVSGVDFNRVSDFWRLGINIWSYNPRSVIAPPVWGGTSELWAVRSKWFPIKIYVTVVAVPQGKTFSGWNNYINAAPPPPPPPSNLIKIMPLGNSITYDDYSGDTRPSGIRKGYRQPLWLKLKEAGFDVDFVGNVKAGENVVPAFDPDNEGHPGWRDDQIASNIFNWLVQKPADLILLHIGTNGLDPSPTDVENILNEIDRYETTYSKHVKVLLSRIIQRSTYSFNTNLFNDNIAAMAQQRISNGDDIRVIAMDTQAGLIYNTSPTGDMRDLLHPNDTGYEKMAQLWFKNLIQVLPLSGTKPPKAPTSLKLVAVNGSSATLSWSDNSYSESGFKIERSTSSSSGFSQIASVTINENQFTDVNLSNGTTYYYRVRAFSDLGNSTYSNIVEATSGTIPPVPVGMTAYWPLDNSGADLSGSNHPLTIGNGALYNVGAKVGSHALQLDGQNDYAESNSIDLGNQFTIALWAKLDSRNNIQTLLANAPGGINKNGFKFFVNTYGSSDRMIRFENGDGTNYDNGNSQSGVFEFGQWNHLAIVVNRSAGSIQFFYNGNNVTDDGQILSNFNTKGPLRLGYMTNNQLPMKGNIDDVKVFNRLLSQAEIQAIITGQSPIIVNAPTALTAILQGTSVKLGWIDNSNNETGFTIERQTGAGSFNVLQKTNSGVTTFTDNTTLEGISYNYRVQAIGEGSSSTYSNIATVLVSTQPPATPTGLSATNITSNSVNLKWIDQSNNETGFMLQQSLNETTGFSTIATTEANTTNFGVTGLTKSTQYYYRVSSINSVNNSGWSNTLLIKTLDTPPAPVDMAAYWPLDNSGADLSGNNHTLTVVNGALYDGIAKVGSHALLLDGQNDYGQSNAIDLGNQFTIAFWTKIPSDFNIQTLLANTKSGANNSGLKLFVNTYGTADRKIILETGNGLTADHASTNSGLFDFGVWNHITLRVNRIGGEARIFYNGIDQTVDNIILNDFDNVSPLRLGIMTNNSFPMIGNMDDVKIYNRLLTQTEINELIGSVLKKGFDESLAVDLPNEFTLKVYPNPFTESLNLKNVQEVKQIEVYTMHGQMISVIRPEGRNEMNINGQQWPTGILVLKVLDYSGSVTIIKVVKN